MTIIQHNTENTLPANLNIGGLAVYEAACRALAVAKSTYDVKDILDKSEAMRVYARQAKNRQLEIDAAEIRIRAERRLGELIREQKRTVGLQAGARGNAGPGRGKRGSELEPRFDVRPTLAEAGIDKKLSSHAQKVADIPEPEFEGILGEWREALEAENARVTTKILSVAKKKDRKKHIEQQKADIESGAVALPEGVFEVVAIDPPWKYGREYDPNGSRVANPYPEMSQAELLSMEPPFADDCVLFLWTTHAFIFDAKALMDAWGFEYKATGVWDKGKMGMGHWLRMQCEFFLLGIKGNPEWNNTSWRDIIREDRREHSRKPDAFYAMVEGITVGRRLDYFSRQQRQGWEVVGNDTEKF